MLKSHRQSHCVIVLLCYCALSCYRRIAQDNKDNIGPKDDFLIAVELRALPETYGIDW